MIENIKTIHKLLLKINYKNYSENIENRDDIFLYAIFDIGLDINSSLYENESTIHKINKQFICNDDNQNIEYFMDYYKVINDEVDIDVDNNKSIIMTKNKNNINRLEVIDEYVIRNWRTRWNGV